MEGATTLSTHGFPQNSGREHGQGTAELHNKQKPQQRATNARGTKGRSGCAGALNRPENWGNDGRSELGSTSSYIWTARRPGSQAATMGQEMEDSFPKTSSKPSVVI